MIQIVVPLEVYSVLHTDVCGPDGGSVVGAVVGSVVCVTVLALRVVVPFGERFGLLIGWFALLPWACTDWPVCVESVEVWLLGQEPLAELCVEGVVVLDEPCWPGWW